MLRSPRLVAARQNGVNTPYGVPSAVSTSPGSNSRFAWKDRVVTPAPRAARSTRSSCSRSAGAYRRLKNNAVAPVWRSTAPTSCSASPCLRISRPPRCVNAAPRAARLWCSHHRAAEPSGRPAVPESSNANRQTTGCSDRTAAVSAGLSPMRRSSRNQTTTGGAALLIRRIYGQRPDGLPHAATAPPPQSGLGTVPRIPGARARIIAMHVRISGDKRSGRALLPGDNFTGAACGFI